jgi:hypothetical protein
MIKEGRGKERVAKGSRKKEERVINDTGQV